MSVKKILFAALVSLSIHFSLFGNAMSIPNHYLPFGLNLSYSDGFQVGGEISYVFFEGMWYGIYADAIYNTHTELGKFSIGPELGFMFFGGDLGFLVADKGNETKLGITGRVLLSYVFGHLYFRVNYLIKDETSIEFGALIKFPTPLK